VACRYLVTYNKCDGDMGKCPRVGVLTYSLYTDEIIGSTWEFFTHMNFSLQCVIEDAQKCRIFM